MKRQSVIAGLVLASALLASAADRSTEQSPLKEWIPFDHPKLVELLQKIDVKDPYTVPPLEIRKDENYAGTTVDVEPFGGVRPFNEFFLKQMEYTGPGRAEPEPEHLDTVKVGFIGMTLEATDTLVAQAGIKGWSFRDEAETANALGMRNGSKPCTLRPVGSTAGVRIRSPPGAGRM